MLYTLWCIIIGEDVEVGLRLDETTTVETLKEKIKTMKGYPAAAYKLTLYQIDVPQGSTEEVKQVSRNLSELNKLKPPETLRQIFSDTNPPPGKIHILVQCPEAGPPEIPLTSCPLYRTLNHTESKTPAQLDRELNDFLVNCRPAMRDLVQKAHDVPSLLPSWKPQPSANEELARHISGLCIPAITGGRPSLLLHALGEEKDSGHMAHIPAVFSFAKHMALINTSGSGKTRLLLEGLCHRWGFYFTAKRDTTEIGSGDFEGVMRELDNAKDYTNAKEIMGAGFGPEATTRAITHMRETARRRLAQLLLARFLLLGLLVQEAGEGLQQKEHRRLWVLLQVQPRIVGRHFEGDVFTDLTALLQGAETHELERRIRRKRAELYHMLQPVRNPATSTNDIPPFFCVLDEVQATVASPSGRLGEFMSDANKTARPTLREIWLEWSSISQEIRLVLSGTGIQFQDLEDTLSSTACKEQKYDIVRDIGAFDSREDQTEYIKRYLPAAWDEVQWEEFLDRAWRWLRGRCWSW